MSGVAAARETSFRSPKSGRIAWNSLTIGSKLDAQIGCCAGQPKRACDLPVDLAPLSALSDTICSIHSIEYTGYNSPIRSSQYVDAPCPKSPSCCAHSTAQDSSDLNCLRSAIRLGAIGA